MNVTSAYLNGIPSPALPHEEEEDASVNEYKYILPIIVFFGLSGNIISLVTIFHSRLRRVGANVYLIVLTIADSSFLLGLLLVCVKVDFINYWYCVGLEYVLMTASYVSSWATAFLTIERYLAIAHPLRHVRYDHVDRVKMVSYWVPIPFLLQFWQFVSLVPSTDADMRACTLTEASYQIIAQAVDTLLCYVIPCSVIVVLNIMVALKLRNSTHFGCEEIAAKENLTRRQGGSHSNGTWATILWVMPLVFVVLNTPFYAIMMVEVVFQVIYEKAANQLDRSYLFVFIYNTAHYMYYLNSAIDVVVYAFSSANFRKTAIIAWRRIICPGYLENTKSKAAGITEHSTVSRSSYRTGHNAVMSSSRKGSRDIRHENDNSYNSKRSSVLIPLNTQVTYVETTTI
ncbi:unnamed protein product [Auanema sp. JU1783]|nr:unnamed protein product [Auanema sp. JU1783]